MRVKYKENIRKQDKSPSLLRKTTMKTMQHESKPEATQNPTQKLMTVAEMFGIETPKKGTKWMRKRCESHKKARCSKCYEAESVYRSQEYQDDLLVIAQKQYRQLKLSELQLLLEFHQQSRMDTNILVNYVESKFDNLIDQISFQRDKTTRELILMGLQKSEKLEKSFQKLLEDSKGDPEKEQMVPFQFGTSREKDTISNIGEGPTHNTLNSLKESIKTTQREVSKLSELISAVSSKYWQKNLVKSGELQIQSAVITEANQFKNLIEFFKSNKKPLSPQSFTLLYRASQNRFKVRKFREKCDGIPNTVVLIKTQKGKIIGGFTPLSWKDYVQCWQADESGLSFVFSITENAKFTLEEDKRHQAIYHDPYDGPNFGFNLLLSDLSDNYNNCYQNIGERYTNPEFVHFSANCRYQFTGVVDSIHFTAVEWEVYEVKF